MRKKKYKLINKTSIHYQNVSQLDHLAESSLICQSSEKFSDYFCLGLSCLPHREAPSNLIPLMNPNESYFLMKKLGKSNRVLYHLAAINSMLTLHDFFLA